MLNTTSAANDEGKVVHTKLLKIDRCDPLTVDLRISLSRSHRRSYILLEGARKTN